MYHTRQFYTYKHDVLNILHPRFPQESITKGVHGENLLQNNPCNYYPIIPTHPNTRNPPHLHHHMPPHLYPSIPPNQVFLCTYFTSTPMYSPYVVPRYPHKTYLGYIHTSSSILTSSILPPNS